MMENLPWPPKCQQSGAETADNEGQDADTGDNQGDQEAQTYDNHNGTDSFVISEKARQLIALIVEQMKELSNAEKYLLYLKLFQASHAVDPLRQPLNPLGSRSEINRTISWIKTHLEEDAETSLPKQEVYEEYTLHCSQNQIKSLSQADFGKVMKQVYPKVRARRLGTRGNSRYCYSGLRRCIKLKAPKLPDLSDKPLSTEAPCTQSTLTAAAWLIVKEWSELHFKVQFPSLQALARFLVITHSVGVGTDAANQLTSATEGQMKTEMQNGKAGKHREMQLQLQKKIQQKNEVKERKRKMQSPKGEPKQNGKKSKPPALSTPSIASPTLESSTSSTSTSPITQGKPIICDKSFDFTTTTTTQLTALPDFNSFQKPAIEQQNGVGANKMVIPRLAVKAPQSPLASPKKQPKNVKYKAIQPKPCDNATYNPQPNAADLIGSQGVPYKLDKLVISAKKEDVENCDAPVFPLPRERLDSISSVDKDAMDEYLGTNNSQHEEELSKYFSNNIEPSPSDQDNSTKISQLRQLLEQNGISDNKNFISNAQTLTLSAPLIDSLAVNVYSVPLQNHPQTAPLTGGARRRVSFETPFHTEDAVPPSPNTRRKNFSFTPISPQSPNGRQSTNVSPFVSPRNTPVPRSKVSTQSASRLKRSIKREIDLSVDIPDDTKVAELLDRTCTAMSAPASPMCHAGAQKSVLEKLLHSNSKVTYTPNYSEMADQLTDYTYRSQSVPVNQLSNADFNDFDSITESVNVNGIIKALDEQQYMSDFNMLDYTHSTSRQMARSQSIDVAYDLNKPTNGNPSRSVPNTPLSFPSKTLASNSSRSYPSTPLLVPDSFNYALNADCLLNGQPIRSRDQMTFFMGLEESAIEEEFEISAMGETENGLMDENGVLIEQSYEN